MATAVKRIEPPVPVKVRSTIELTLSMAEAETLLAIGQKIGGNATRTRRGHMDAINSALFGAGVGIPTASFDSRHDNSIYFATEEGFNEPS